MSAPVLRRLSVAGRGARAHPSLAPSHLCPATEPRKARKRARDAAGPGRPRARRSRSAPRGGNGSRSQQSTSRSGTAAGPIRPRTPDADAPREGTGPPARRRGSMARADTRPRPGWRRDRPKRLARPPPRPSPLRGRTFDPRRDARTTGATAELPPRTPPHLHERGGEESDGNTTAERGSPRATRSARQRWRKDARAGGGAGRPRPAPRTHRPGRQKRTARPNAPPTPAVEPDATPRDAGGPGDGPGAPRTRETEARPTASAFPYTASRPGSTDPALRANPCPEVTDPACRLPLPTLFHRTRGCSPWRPAADMGTAQSEIQSSHPDFQGAARARRTPQEPRRSAGRGPLSRVKPIPGRPSLHEEKKTLPGTPAAVSRRALRYRNVGRPRRAQSASTRTIPRPFSALWVRGSEPDSLSLAPGRMGAHRPTSSARPSPVT